MKVQAETIEEFFTADPEKEADLRAVDQLVRETLPGVSRELMNTSSITLLAYRPEGTSHDDWPPIGLAPQKHYISLYVSGEKQGQPLGDYYADRLGETNNGKACIRFRKLADVSRDELRQLILDAAG